MADPKAEQLEQPLPRACPRAVDPIPKPVAGVQRRQTGDRRAVLLLRTPQFVELLEVEPKLARRPEEASQAQRRVAGHGAAAVEDFGDPVHRDFDPPGKLRRTHPERVEILAQRLARMNGFAHHDVPPSQW